MSKRFALACVLGLAFVSLVSSVQADDDIPKAAWKTPSISTMAFGKARRSAVSAPALSRVPFAATSPAGT